MSPLPGKRRGAGPATAGATSRVTSFFLCVAGGWLFFLCHYFSDGHTRQRYQELSVKEVEGMDLSPFGIMSNAFFEADRFLHAGSGAGLAREDPEGGGADAGGKCPGGIVALTYASHGGRDDRFCRTLESAVRNNVSLRVLGWGAKWEGLAQKLRASHEAVSALPPDCVVLFTDGFDVLFLDSLATMRQRFLGMGVPLLFSGECGCWPQITRGIDVCNKQYPQAPTLYRYLNTGAWMGFADKAGELLSAIIEHGGADFNKLNDQELVSDMYMAGKFNITLDHYARILQCVHATDAPLARCHPEEHLYDKDGLWYNKYTESKPAVFHFNGGGKKLHLPMESRVWYKKPEFKATDNTEAVLDSELEMGGEMRRLRDVCPPHVYQIGS